MRYIVLFSLFFSILSTTVANNVTAYFSYGLFNTPKNKPYLETYLTILGNSVKYNALKEGYQASVKISMVITKQKQLVKQEAYNLLSPVFSDTLHPLSFVDNQRFSLDNGIYELELTISDNNNLEKKSFKHVETITIQFSTNKIEASSIQVLESYKKTEVPTTISKSGYDLVPYNLNYFPDNIDKLSFYAEVYNLEKHLGKNARLFFNYFIERFEDSSVVTGCSGFSKQVAKPINPLLTQLNISALATGNYNLVLEVRDSTNVKQLQKKWFFQRKKEGTDVNSMFYKNSIDTYFTQFSSVDTLKMFIECLWPISTTKEREWQQNQLVKKNPELMQKYLVDYWKAEAGDTIEPMKLWLAYYKDVKDVNASFKCGKQKGYYTDRGRVYLQYGKPSQRVQTPSDPNSYPYEIWQYYRIEDKTTGQFHSNKRFVFMNSNIADDCYKLIHSDMKGEIYNARWKYLLVKRTQQNNNIDKTDPEKTYGNNADELFNDTR